MGISKKINTAFVILKQKGAAGVFDTIRQKIVALTCTNENEIIYEIFQNSTQKGVMCDVGAHYGYCLLPFAKAGWQIFAFEPDPQNHSHLLQSTSMYPNVYLDGRAVSDKLEASVPFFTSKESSGVSGLSPFLSSHELAYTVSTTTLGDFFREQQVVSVDYLKIDTEGFDLMVLQGLSWDQIHPRVIICEFEDSKTQKLEYTYKTLAEYLVDKGYHVLVSEWRPIVKYGEQHAWRGYFTYPHQLHDDKAWGNLVATNDDELYNQLLSKCKPKGDKHKLVQSI